MRKYWKGFLMLLERYQKGVSTTKEKRIMDIWYDSLEAEQEERPGLSEEELKKEMWLDISAKMRRGPGYRSVEEKRWWQSDYFKVAAAAVLLLSGYILYWSQPFRQALISGVPDSEISQLEKASNAATVARKIVLSDGSNVTLDPGAVLFYAKEFSRNKRIVYLKGNGMFEVARDPGRPFFVYTDDIVTKVLGTSFTIRKAERSGAIEVAVITGKVMVEKTAGSNDRAGLSAEKGVTLTPNRKVTYYARSEQYVTGLVDAPRIIEKGDDYHKPDAFVFREIPLSTVLEKLEKAYGIKIEVSSERLNNCRITADLSKDDLYGRLEIICAAVNARFELTGDKVMVAGQGCDL
ncbi:FecR family protein [Ravibacter arvi]